MAKGFVYPNREDRHKTGRCTSREPHVTLDGMCRNIKVLHNFEPPATTDEVRAAALQYVRKVSGSTHPSAANRAVFESAVDEIAHLTQHLLDDLITPAAPRDREIEAARARARNEKRFGVGAAR